MPTPLMNMSSLPISCPVRPPHDFCLSGFHKDHIYYGCKTNLADLKVSIVCHVSFIPTDMLRAAVDNAVVSLFQHIIDRQGMYEKHATV